MNTILNLEKNLLFLSQSGRELLKVCVEYIKQYKLVLLFTKETEEILLLIKESSPRLNRQQMESLVIVQADQMKGFIEKVLDLQSWTWLPKLIVVDLRALIDKLSDELLTTVHGQNYARITFFQQLVFFIVNLMEFNSSISRRSIRQTVNEEHCFTVLVLKEHFLHLTKLQIEVIVNLYYYVNNAFEDEEEVINLIKLNL